MAKRIVEEVHEDRTYEITFDRNVESQRVMRVRVKRNSGDVGRDYAQMLEMEVDSNYFELEPNLPPDWHMKFDAATSEMILYSDAWVTEVFRWPCKNARGEAVTDPTGNFKMLAPRSLP